jgi:hypothetical protein
LLVEIAVGGGAVDPVGGLGGGVATPDPGADVVQGDLLYERGSVLAKVPPLEYLKIDADSHFTSLCASLVLLTRMRPEMRDEVPVSAT